MLNEMMNDSAARLDNEVEKGGEYNRETLALREEVRRDIASFNAQSTVPSARAAARRWTRISTGAWRRVPSARLMAASAGGSLLYAPGSSVPTRRSLCRPFSRVEMHCNMLQRSSAPTR
jgi:hypothetical protein